MDLNTLPPDIFEIVLTYLDLNTVKALRLTDRKLAKKCIGPRFLGSIQQPICDVSSQTLRSLRALSCNPALSKMIHSLTFLATNLDASKLEKNVESGKYDEVKVHGRMFERTTIPYSAEGLSEAKSDLNWLKEQQRARVNESSSEMIELLQLSLRGFNPIHSIRLDGALILGRTQRASTEKGAWHPFWMRASQVFSWIVTAIVQSGSSVKKLDVYRSTPRCCIPSSHITTYASDLDLKQLGTLCENLESLELSMSAEIQNDLDIAEVDEDALETDEGSETESDYGASREGHLSWKDPRAVLADTTPGITSLLKSAPALRELDLFFRNALQDGALDSYDRIIESIADETQFPELERCALSGFMAKEESILLFLRKHPNLRSFTLHECNLTTGSWNPIFSHLERSMPKLDNLSLSNLSGKHTQCLRYLRMDAASNSNTEGQDEEEDEQEVDRMTPSQTGANHDVDPNLACLACETEYSNMQDRFKNDRDLVTVKSEKYVRPFEYQDDEANPYLTCL
ncbi:hypothetical protein PENVUL_c069G09362 [Penicillium vulpinum]|uniref:F-box domain-containing protein n=1 Tax=Penicillium vulpinum TaxID=29845 RepID=A0A1V6RBK4_9EURO|nr:hypothetical protein PENVUL_c069G09362 [Penicillium vulpinum]